MRNEAGHGVTPKEAKLLTGDPAETMLVKVLPTAFAWRETRRE